MVRIECTSELPTPQFKAMNEPSFSHTKVRLKRLAELTLELNQLGDSTPPPYNYRYDRVELGLAGYVLYSEDRENLYYIPKAICSLYSPEQHRNFNEMIGCLDNYFRIKKEIYDLA